MADRSASVTITRSDAGLYTVRGRIYRALFATDIAHVLSGSTRPGRFTPPGGKTLYTSTTAAGTMIALEPYTRPDDPERIVVPLEVDAAGICDLRDRESCLNFGFDPAEAALPWRQALSRGEHPRSWAIVERLIGLGAKGVIDPSRRDPALVHLALFFWNAEGEPSVRLAEGSAR